MYYNEEHKKRVEERGDGYEYIGSYKYGDLLKDKKRKIKKTYIRVKCPYCGKEYDVDIYSFRDGANCNSCCNKYENSFAYHVQVELCESLNKYWDWEENELNPYLITKQSNKKVWIKCDKTDYHGSYLTSIYDFYGGNRCPYCSRKNGKIHPKDSFGQWLINIYGDDAINKYWSEKNIVNPFEIPPKSSSKKVWILCQEKDYHNDKGGYLITPAHFTEGNRCPYCSHKSGKVHYKDSFGQWLVNTYGKDAIEKYWSPKNILNPFEINKNNLKTIWILCQEKDYHNDDGGYKTTPSKFYNGRRCPYCVGKKVHIKDSFGTLYPEYIEYWSSNNKKSPFEVAPHTNKKYKFICEKCNKEFERVLNSINLNKTGLICRNCNGSILEQKTKEILEKYNIKYKREKIFRGLIGLGGFSLRFDFYLPDYNLLVECQGVQHEKWQKTWMTKYKFKRQLEHDRRKREYAKLKNIDLLEIWYYDIDNIENIIINKLNLK